MKQQISLLTSLIVLGTLCVQAQPNKSRSSRRSKKTEDVQWVKSDDQKPQSLEGNTHDARPENNTQLESQEQPAQEAPADTVKPDMLLSLRNLLNFLAASHIKTGLPSTKDSVASPCLGYTPDGACIMVANESQASKWNVANKSIVGTINPTEVQKGSNISPDGTKKAIINGEERLIVINTKTNEQIIGPSLAGYQIMLGKPKLSWSHINPVWCPDGQQCAIGADGLIVLINIPHLIEVDTFIRQANPQQLSVLEKIHTGYRNFDKGGKTQLAAAEKQIFNDFPHIVSKALKPYIQ